MKTLFGRSCTKKDAKEMLEKGAIVVTLGTPNGLLNFVSFGKVAEHKEKVIFRNMMCTVISECSKSFVNGKIAYAI